MIDEKRPPVVEQSVVPLGGDYYMVKHVTKSMCEIIWNFIDDNQRAELFALYGKDEATAKEGLWREICESGHHAAFYDGLTLVCAMWAEWTEIKGVGLRRVLGCFCNTEYAKRMTRKFVKFTPICRDAFELTEPSDVDELFVFIDEKFDSSRRWAVKAAGFVKAFDAHFNGYPFVCYSRKIGGCDGL